MISAGREAAVRLLGRCLSRRWVIVLGCSGCLTAQGVAQTLADGPGEIRPAAVSPALASARQLIASGEFKRAEAALRAYLATDEGSASGRYLLAYTLFRLDKPQDSLAEYTHAAKIQKPSAEDLKNVALDYVLLDDYTDADKWMSLSVQMNDKDPDAWYGLGRIRYTRQHFQDAVDCFTKTLALDPASVKAEDNLGLAYEGLNRTDDAIKAYQAALALEAATSSSAKPPSEQPMLNLAIVLIHHGRPEEALPLLTRAIAIAPRDPKIREQLGHLYLQQGKLVDAQREFEEAVSLSPESAAMHFLLGQVYRRQGMDEKAREEFARAAVLNGSHSTPEKN
jgi:tetratricopeptide (TPR) repeat protein